MAEQMTGAEMVIRALVDQGVEHIFGYPGGAALPIYDALYQQTSVKHILVRHEQGAGHMAEGYARSTGKVGVVLVTSGPGATNTVTPLTDALMDSIPLVVLTAQVPTTLIGSDAFQECDTVGITRSCTKHNFLVKDVNQLSRVLHEAFYIANSGRPGPVLVDIPKDVQFALGTYHAPDEVQVERHKSYHPRTEGDAGAVASAVESTGLNLSSSSSPPGEADAAGAGATDGAGAGASTDGAEAGAEAGAGTPPHPSATQAADRERVDVSFIAGDVIAARRPCSRPDFLPEDR